MCLGRCRDCRARAPACACSCFACRTPSPTPTPHHCPPLATPPFLTGAGGPSARRGGALGHCARHEGGAAHVDWSLWVHARDVSLCAVPGGQGEPPAAAADDDAAAAASLLLLLLLRQCRPPYSNPPSSGREGFSAAERAGRSPTSTPNRPLITPRREEEVAVLENRIVMPHPESASLVRKVVALPAAAHQGGRGGRGGKGKAPAAPGDLVAGPAGSKRGVESEWQAGSLLAEWLAVCGSWLEPGAYYTAPSATVARCCN